MESNIKASFIPDNMPTSRQRGPSQSSGGGAGDIFILVAIVALAAALALAAGVFLYDRFLDANVQKKSEQLERARQAFEPVLIQELVRLDSRLQAADDVLTGHLAPSELFNLLEELTLQSVSYESMDYTVKEDDSIHITIKGKAHSVNGVALQASVFGQHNAITNPIFSDLDLVGSGVTFSVSATVNPSALRYSTVFNQYLTGATGSGTFDNSEVSPDVQAESAATGAPQTEEFGDFGGAATGEDLTQ